MVPLFYPPPPVASSFFFSSSFFSFFLFFSSFFFSFSLLFLCRSDESDNSSLEESPAGGVRVERQGVARRSGLEG